MRAWSKSWTMRERRIDIDRLDIRLKGVSPELARAAVGDLGRDLTSQLAAARQDQGDRRTGSLDRAASGTVRLAPGATPSELRRTIAGRIAAVIRSTTKT